MESVLLTKQPELPLVQEVRALEALCRAHDHLEGSLFLNPSLNVSEDMPCLLTIKQDEALIGAMTFFAPTLEEAELVGLTHPEHRRKGIFRTLIGEAARQAKQFGIPSLLFICEPQSANGIAAVTELGAEPAHVEYSLCYDRAGVHSPLVVPEGLALFRGTEEDLDAMAHISALSFQEPEEQARGFMVKAMSSDHRTQYIARLNGLPVGIGCIGYEDGEATIYGLGVLPDMQGRGIGRGIIALMLDIMRANNTERILIEVDDSNANALHLYLSCGFVQESVYTYYRAPVERFLLK